MTQGLIHFLWSAGGFIVVLGVLIFVHELGHFIMAKIMGIRVETFSLGFGPRIWGFTRGNTDYRLSAVPLGGYVKMLGENPDEELRGSPEEFLSRKRWERFLVLVMGPAVNLAFAYLIYVAVFMVGVTDFNFRTVPAIVGGVEDASPAAEAGLLPGDRILGAGGEEIATFSDFLLFVGMNPGERVTFELERGGEVISAEVEIGTTKKRRLGVVGVTPAIIPQVQIVNPGSPAEAGGLRVGDLLLSAGGERLFWGSAGGDLADTVQAHAGQPLAFTVIRDGQDLSLTLVPDAETGTIGISHGAPKRKFGFFGALGEAGRRCMRESTILFKTVRKLLTGSISMRSLSGPLEIASFSGSYASFGFIPFLEFMAMVSLQLGLINLFPIPVLDGGHILILAVEGTVRREFSPVFKERLMMVGIFMLMALMAVVLYFDVVKMFIPEG